MKKRGYIHKSPLDKNLAIDTNIQNELVNTIDEQKNIIKQKTVIVIYNFFREKIKRGFFLLGF